MDEQPIAGRSAVQLRRLVGRAAWPGLVGTALSLLLVVVMLTYLVFVLQPHLSDLRRGQQAARDANAAMLDQETGIRGYLATWDEDFLGPYRTGAKETAKTEPIVVDSLRRYPQLITRSIASISSSHGWQSQWAVPSVSSRTAADLNGDGVVQASELSAYLERGKALFDDYRIQDEGLRRAIKAEIEATENRIGTTLGIGGVLLLLVGAASILGLNYRRKQLQELVVAPVVDLAESVDRVRSGDLTPSRSPHAVVAELGDLADGVDAMTHALAERAAAAEHREVVVTARADRLQRVLDLSRDLTESLSLRYTTLRLVNAVCELAGAERAELWLQSEDAQKLVLFETSDQHEEAEEQPVAKRPQVVDIGAGPIGRAARYGRALPLDESVGVGDDLSGGAAIPMVVGAKVVAVVTIVARPGTPLDLTLLDGLLLQGATAVQAAQLHAEVEEMSHRDALTGLSNRRQFDADLLNEVERAHRYDRPLSLVMIDLDHFKKVNDVYGHRRGDEVLQDVAGMLSTDLREIDTCYRYGGEELCILLPECTSEQAAEAVDRVRERVAGAFVWATKPPVSLSAGVAQLTGAMNPSALVGAADQALYAAKHAGRNRIEVAE